MLEILIMLVSITILLLFIAFLWLLTWHCVLKKEEFIEDILDLNLLQSRIAPKVKYQPFFNKSHQS